MQEPTPPHPTTTSQIQPNTFRRCPAQQCHLRGPARCPRHSPAACSYRPAPALARSRAAPPSAPKRLPTYPSRSRGRPVRAATWGQPQPRPRPPARLQPRVGRSAALEPRAASWHVCMGRQPRPQLVPHQLTTPQPAASSADSSYDPLVPQPQLMPQMNTEMTMKMLRAGWCPIS